MTIQREDIIKPIKELLDITISILTSNNQKILFATSDGKFIIWTCDSIEQFKSNLEKAPIEYLRSLMASITMDTLKFMEKHDV